MSVSNVYANMVKRAFDLEQENAKLQAQLATAKGEVWDLVIDELQDRWDIESPYLDERVRILRDWCTQQKEAL